MVIFSARSTLFQKVIYILSHIAKKVTGWSSICKAAYGSQGCLKKDDFWLILGKIIHF